MMMLMMTEDDKQIHIQPLSPTTSTFCDLDLYFIFSIEHLSNKLQLRLIKEIPKWGYKNLNYVIDYLNSNRRQTVQESTYNLI